MKVTKSLSVLSIVALLSICVKAEKYQEEPMQEVSEGLKPQDVKKEWRIKALNEEIKFAENNLNELKKSLAGVAKGSEQATILELRGMLKEDFLGGLKNLLDMEEGKIKKQDMGDEYQDESIDQPQPRAKQPKRVQAQPQQQRGVKAKKTKSSY